jgi:lysophospholipase L1-like esterase
MTHNLGLPLALLLIVSGCRSERFDTVRNIGSVGDTIVCFGDSLTEGVGAEAREEYPTILSRLLGSGC